MRFVKPGEDIGDVVFGTLDEQLKRMMEKDAAERMINPPIVGDPAPRTPPRRASVEEILVLAPTAEIEAVARAICADDGADPDEVGCFWALVRAAGPRWWLFVSAAEAAISAVDAVRAAAPPQQQEP